MMTSNRQNVFNLSTSQNEQTLRKDVDETGGELAFDFDYFSKINGALYCNDAPLFNALDVVNNSRREIASLRLDFSSTPEVFKPFSLYLDRLAPNESRRVVRFDASLNYEFLARISEQTRAEIRIDAFENERKRGTIEEKTDAKRSDLIYSQTFPIDVCANDEWFGVSVWPSLLAAFVTPNLDAVARILGDAAQILKKNNLKPSLEGYQSRDKKRVYDVVRAVYEAVAQRQIHYATPPASFGERGQRVRFADKVLRDKLGTCLDLSLLFASALEQCGLHPLIVLVSGHAFVGCHLKETTFLEAFDDDPQTLRKRAELDDLVVFETTLATDGSNATFSLAESSAKKRLENDENFIGVLDVKRARLEQIRPIPLKRGEDDCVEIDFNAEKARRNARTAIDAARPLLPEIETTDEILTPKNRVERWKQNLLDLTLRNKLLNCKEKQTVSLLPPDARLDATLEALSQEKSFLIRPAQSVLKDDSPRDFGAVERNKGVDVPQAVLKEGFKKGVLYAKPDLDEAELQKRLTKIYRDARSSLNEGDVNTLFLVFGVVERVHERDGKKYRAPLLLSPVEITQLSKKEGFVIDASDDEARLNVTLFEQMRRDFAKEVRGLDPNAPPTTADDIVDVEKIFQIFRRELLELDGWELKNEICLGNFSFQKFVMWSDLNEHMDELEETPLVNHLIYTPKERFDDGIVEIEANKVDAVAVDEIIAPLSADSSQIAALLNAAAGKNFVLQGPPGTGKSQTIANIIAHCLAEGKSTLFVSEKRAALDVVYRRLCGLGLE
ncbi:MAG: DUF4011 domain-containing protein, partial [Thermoguttaceae bacterium]|nr:DUF4011 domain-containing protein [Thermoguttaceae bacterium]